MRTILTGSFALALATLGFVGIAPTAQAHCPTNLSSTCLGHCSVNVALSYCGTGGSCSYNVAATCYGNCDVNVLAYCSSTGTCDVNVLFAGCYTLLQLP